MKNDAFIRDLLAAATEMGILEAEVYYHEQESMRVLVDKGAIEEYAVNATQGLSLRGLADGGKMGNAYTEAFDRDAIIMLVRGVLESANLISDTDEQEIFAGSPSYAKVDSTGDLGTPEQRIDLALALDKKARGINPLVEELGYTFVETERETVRIVNTNGLDLSHTTDISVAYADAIARRGERVATSDGLGIAGSLSQLNIDEIANEAVSEAVFQLDAAPCDSGEMPVIFRNTAMASLLGAFSSVFSADAAQKGMSLLAGKEGTMIAAPCVTLVDDPLLAGSLFSRPFDGEGVATYTKDVISGGELKTLLHNLKTAKKAGTTSTGNAARSGYAGPIGVSPSNFFIKPGTQDLPALEEEMQNGLVIMGITGLHAGTNAISGDFSLLSYGYLVEDGKRGRAVEQVTVAGNFFDLLKNIVAIGSDLRSKGSSISSPSVRIKSLSVAGK